MPKNLPVVEPDDMFAKIEGDDKEKEVDMAENLSVNSALDNGLLKKKAEFDRNAFDKNTRPKNRFWVKFLLLL